MYALHQEKMPASEAVLAGVAKMVVVATMVSSDGARGNAPDQRTP
jgi:hypothetical protein